MPTSNNNSESRESYLAKITHPRKKELATMILDGASLEDMNAAGFGRLNILEAARVIRRNVQGQENLQIDIPRGEGMDSTSAADIERTAAADEAEKKASAEASQVEQGSPASVTAQTAADSAPGAEVTSPSENANMSDQDQNHAADGNPETDHVAPDGNPVPGVDADDNTAHPTETLGGNPVGTLTGEEDAETLQRKADEEAAANAGDAA